MKNIQSNNIPHNNNFKSSLNTCWMSDQNLIKFLRCLAKKRHKSPALRDEKLCKQQVHAHRYNMCIAHRHKVDPKLRPGGHHMNYGAGRMSWEINAARRSWFIAVSNEWHDKIFKKLFPLHLEEFIISTRQRARIKQKALNGDSWNSCRCATCGSSARRPRKGQGWPLAGGAAAAAQDTWVH